LARHALHNCQISHIKVLYLQIGIGHAFQQILVKFGRSGVEAQNLLPTEFDDDKFSEFFALLSIAIDAGVQLPQVFKIGLKYIFGMVIVGPRPLELAEVLINIAHALDSLNIEYDHPEVILGEAGHPSQVAGALVHLDDVHYGEQAIIDLNVGSYRVF
jgi:hypothetical protein